jgi:hypothetical protein
MSNFTFLKVEWPELQMVSLNCCDG